MQRTDPGALTPGGRGWQGEEGLEGGAGGATHPASQLSGGFPEPERAHRGPCPPIRCSRSPGSLGSLSHLCGKPRPRHPALLRPCRPSQEGIAWGHSLGRILPPGPFPAVQGPCQGWGQGWVAGKIGAHWGQLGAGKGLWVWEWTQNERPGGRGGLAGDGAAGTRREPTDLHTHTAVAAPLCRGPRAAESLSVTSAIEDRGVGTGILLSSLSP